MDHVYLSRQQTAGLEAPCHPSFLKGHKAEWETCFASGGAISSTRMEFDNGVGRLLPWNNFDVTKSGNGQNFCVRQRLRRGPFISKGEAPSSRFHASHRFCFAILAYRLRRLAKTNQIVYSSHFTALPISALAGAAPINLGSTLIFSGLPCATGVCIILPRY